MTCATAFELFLAENTADADWATKMADLFEMAGGGGLSETVLALVGETTSWEDRLRLWATEFSRNHPDLVPLLEDQLDDLDFLAVLSRYQEVFNDSGVNKESAILMVKDVCAFAQSHPVLDENLDRFLTSDTSGGLEALHRLEIAHIFAHADIEDATAILLNLDDVTIVSTTKPGVFISPEKGGLGGKMRINLDDSFPERGKYFTLIHEMSHAADYNSGVKSSGDGWITGGFTNSAGLTLDQVAEDEFVNDARGRLDAIAARQHPDMTEADRDALVDETINHLTQRPGLSAAQFRDAGWREEGAHGVSQDSGRLYWQLDSMYDDLLYGPYPSAPSDVFGGITNFKIRGSWGHGDHYWYSPIVNSEVRSVERELFAETMAWRIMAAQDDKKTPDGEEEKPDHTPGLDAIHDFLPGSEEMVAQIADDMGDHE